MNTNHWALNGTWRRCIGETVIDEVSVPGSIPPMGIYALERDFDLPAVSGNEGRYFLCTEGVLSKAEFFLNGKSLGTAGPWAFYRFELPRESLKKKNVIRAEIVDILETFGPMPGRRYDGGLVRDLWIERRSKTFLETFAFRYDLLTDLSTADCTVEINLNGPSLVSGSVTLAEKKSGRIVAQDRTGKGGITRFRIDNPRLWSPETPQLYTLTVTLENETWETLSEAVGFRRIEVRGTDIFLNQKRLFLKGVCRHEFTAAHGYSPPKTAIHRELSMIKRAGFNYVRLVHSPQSPLVCRLAAELGLLVSEEPGTCFHNLSDEAIAAPALECLRRTVLRDRNVPSILAWYIYNECPPSTPYAVKAAEVCRKLDPDCRLSFADCSGENDNIKAMVKAANLSWYGINIYDFRAEPYSEGAKAFQDKPFVVTEWGGWCAQGNLRVLGNLCDMFIRHARPDATVRIAGCSFWAWADYEERSRPEPSAIDGWTIEGLVDRKGAAKPDLGVMSRMWKEMDYPRVPRIPVITVLKSKKKLVGPWKPVSLSGILGDPSLDSEVAEMRKKYSGQNPVFGKMRFAGVPFECRETPLLLGKSRPELVIPINASARRIAFLGHAALKGGYPSSAVWSVHHRDAEPKKEFGSDASEYTFEFKDGPVKQSLRHGIHMVRANTICRWWLTDPRGPSMLPAVQALIHPSYEILRLNVWMMEFPKASLLTAIRWRIKDEDSIQALYAVSVCG